MFITLSKSTINFCQKNIDKINDPKINNTFKDNYNILYGRISYGCGIFYNDFDWRAFDKKFMFNNIINLPLNERISRLDELIEIGEKANKDYDEMCIKASSVTVEGVIADDKSTSCIYLDLPCGYAYRIFADRLDINVQKYVRANVGKKARVTGFSSICENATSHAGITVAKSIEIISD
jgi:hypothetical protein